MEINTENLDSNREQWASIDGYRNYEVSWFGRVRNIDTNRILKGIADTYGYCKVNLSKNQCFFLDRLFNSLPSNQKKFIFGVFIGKKRLKKS